MSTGDGLPGELPMAKLPDDDGGGGEGQVVVVKVTRAPGEPLLLAKAPDGGEGGAVVVLEDGDAYAPFLATWQKGREEATRDDTGTVCCATGIVPSQKTYRSNIWHAGRGLT